MYDSQGKKHMSVSQRQTEQTQQVASPDVSQIPLCTSWIALAYDPPLEKCR